MSDDLLEQARQYVASFEAIGATVAYPFSVRLAKRVISLSEARSAPTPSSEAREIAERIVKTGEALSASNAEIQILARALLSLKGGGG